MVLLSLGLSLAGPIADQAANPAGTAEAEAKKTWFGFNEDPISSGYSLQRQLNAPVRRMALYWRHVEPTKGNWDWSRYDEAYSEMVSAGLKPLLVVFQAPCWAVPSVPYERCSTWGGYPPDRAYDAYWGRFIHKLTTRYPKAMAIEIWNEPNLSAMFQPKANPARYTQLLRTAYGAVKRVNRRMPVISGGLLPGDGKTKEGPAGMADEEFLRRMYASGARGYLNGIGSHPYNADKTHWNVRSVTAAIGQLRMARNAARASSTPIWITETGESTAFQDRYAPPATPSQQAADLVRLVRYYASRSDIPVALIHRLADSPYLHWKPIESGFGVFTEKGSPKPAACALSREWGGSLQCP